MMVMVMMMMMVVVVMMEVVMIVMPVMMSQGAIIRVLTYRRYANITVWYFFVFSHVPRRYAELLLSAYLFFAGIT
jgi:hypothetical protein